MATVAATVEVTETDTLTAIKAALSTSTAANYHTHFAAQERQESQEFLAQVW
jgi:hypothetical protein